MSKRFYRFFGGLLISQERWLNKMADKGLRLVRVGKLLYEFDSCLPGEYEYHVEFVGHKTKTDSENYRSLLEDFGYKVFYKNINLNYSIGRFRLRPWAEGSSKIATNTNTYNRELMIVEKKRDDAAFELHTTYEDKAAYYTPLRNAWLCIFISLLILAIISMSYIWGIAAGLTLIPAAVYQGQICVAHKESKLKEW